MFAEPKPIDTDTHITEPADVWTARVSKKWADALPIPTIRPASTTFRQVRSMRD